MKIMVTGGAGFIGANFLNGLVPELQEHQFINVDKLTYAANLGSLRAIDSLPNYGLRRVDITDMDGVDAVFDEFDPDLVVHFAAESHVDRSILGPREFVTDRPGHDLRYAIDSSRVREECGWEPKETFDTGIRKTVQWYLSNKDWVRDVPSGEYRQWMDLSYGDRAG